MAQALAVIDRLRGHLDEGAFELETAAEKLSEGAPVAAVLLGQDLGDDAAALAAAFADVYAFDDASLAVPDAGWDGRILRFLVEREGFDVVLLLHGNLALDLAPPLAARLARPLVTDAMTLEIQDGRLHVLRAMYGGKLNARVSADLSKGAVVTLRGGAFPAAEAKGGGAGAGTVHEEALPDVGAPRRRTLRTVEPDASEVDISAADRLVGVGRGIEEEENLEIVQELADALGAELACSRPVVDKGWLPKSRQVGTSGATVKPQIYLAVGISGSFQHVGGIKGSPFIVAVNKDAKAPIFSVADVGVVGDLFDIVPELTAKLKAAKA